MSYRHPLRSLRRRALLACLTVAAIIALGTIGMRVLEGMDYLDAFYFMSMIATAQGPPTAPLTAAGKVFAAFMAFVSVGTVVAALGFLFGPFLGELWHIGVRRFEERIHSFEEEKKTKP